MAGEGIAQFLGAIINGPKLAQAEREKALGDYAQRFSREGQGLKYHSEARGNTISNNAYDALTPEGVSSLMGVDPARGQALLGLLRATQGNPAQIGDFMNDLNTSRDQMRVQGDPSLANNIGTSYFATSGRPMYSATAQGGVLNEATGTLNEDGDLAKALVEYRKAQKAKEYSQAEKAKNDKMNTTLLKMITEQAQRDEDGYAITDRFGAPVMATDQNKLADALMRLEAGDSYGSIAQQFNAAAPVQPIEEVAQPAESQAGLLGMLRNAIAGNAEANQADEGWQEVPGQPGVRFRVK